MRNGVEVSSYFTLEDKKFDLIFIGSIEDRKNAFILPSLVEIIKNIFNDVKLLIISHQGEIEKLKNIINRKGLSKNIEFINYVTEKEKRMYLASSKIFVFPTKYEGTGIVILEALASYLPVVLFDVPTLKLFEKGTLKSNPFDLHDYARKIIYLMKNDDLRKQLGNEGRQDTERRFDIEDVSYFENESIKKIIGL